MFPGNVPAQFGTPSQEPSPNSIIPPMGPLAPTNIPPMLPSGGSSLPPGYTGGLGPSLSTELPYQPSREEIFAFQQWLANNPDAINTEVMRNQSYNGTGFGSSIPGAQQTGFVGPLQDAASFFLPTSPTGVSTLFSQVPTGLANNDVTHTPNNNITVGGSPYMLRTGQTFAPKPGYSIIHGLHQGAYGYYEIPTADVANSAQKYGIFNLGQGPLTTRQMAEMNDPSGYQSGKYSNANNWGFNQTGGWVGTNPGTGGGTGGTGGTGTGGGGTDTTTTTPPPPPPDPPSGPQLPALDANRQRYLDTIDAYIRSQNQYQYASSITDEMRRAMNLPGMAELQMNQAANPQFNAANFTNVATKDGLPFIPGSAAPQGYKWSWLDPDGASGPRPANYALTADQNFFNTMPGSNIEDLQQLVNTFNDPKFANKYLSTGGLGDYASFVLGGQNGQRASLAPVESINLLAPFLENTQVKNYTNQLRNLVSGRLGSGFINFDPYNANNIVDSSKLSDYFRRVNDQLGLLGMPTLDSVLNSSKAGASLDRDQFYGGNSLDFYQPSERAPAFFQYLLGDFDGSGPAPETYGLRLRGNPRTKYDAEQILGVLNDPRYKNMISPTVSNINPNIFTQNLNAEGNPLYTILQAYKFPDGAGGPAGGTQNTTLGTGQQQQQLSMERWVPGAGEQSGAQEVANRQAADSRWQSLYGGGFGTGDLNNQSPPPSGGTTPPGTTPPPATTTGDKPNPFSGVTPPATSGYQRPPKFWSPWAGF